MINEKLHRTAYDVKPDRFTDEQRSEMLIALNWLARDIGLSVRIGTTDKLEIINDEGPSSATLCYDGPSRVVICSQLDSYKDVEAALHELAHAELGIDTEFECYELEAVWALRFPIQVSIAVAEMAHEVGYYV